jgi:hypothetical protein
MGRLWWVAVCLALPFSFATAASLELYTVPLAALQVRCSCDGWARTRVPSLQGGLTLLSQRVRAADLA